MEAYCLGRLNDRTADAETRFLNLLRKVPDYKVEDQLSLFHWRAIYLEEQQRWREAISAHQRCATLSEEQRWRWEHIGDLYRDQLKELDQAFNAYNKSLGVDPGGSSPFAVYSAYEASGHWTEAIVAWQRYAKSSEEPAEVWEHIGDLYRDHVKDPDEAIEAYEKSLEADPNRSSPLFELVTTYEAREWWTEAAEACDRVAKLALEGDIAEAGRMKELTDLGLDPQLAVRLPAIFYLDKGGETAEAAARFKRLLEEAPDSVGLVGAWEMFLTGQERWEEIVEAWRSLAELSEEHRAAAWEHIGDLYRDQVEDPVKAIKAYEKSLEADPDRSSPLFELARTYESLERWMEAAAACERIAAADQERRLVGLASAALALGKAGQVAEAADRLEKLLEEAPENQLVASAWQLFLGDQGRWEEAVGAYERFRSLPKEHQQQHLLSLGERIVLEVGEKLIDLFDPEQGSEIISRLQEIREQLIRDSCFVMPPVRIRDSQLLHDQEYVLTIRGREILRKKVHSRYVALGSFGATPLLGAVETVEPAYELPVFWISEEQTSVIGEADSRVIAAADLVTSNLKKILEQNNTDPSH